jgi:hypothetical protein
MERNWFSLKNFHMQFFEDSERLNGYLHHWEGGQQMEDYFGEVWQKLPRYLKFTAWFSRHIPPCRWLVEGATRIQLKRLATKPEGTLHWIRHQEEGKIGAFFGPPGTWEEIGGWDLPLPSTDHSQGYRRLDHGYDESKKQLDMADLREAARFRGGSLESKSWAGDLDRKLDWQCGLGHRFELTPRTVLKGGHWCLQCIERPRDYRQIGEKNPFAAQVMLDRISV